MGCVWSVMWCKISSTRRSWLGKRKRKVGIGSSKRIGFWFPRGKEAAQLHDGSQKRLSCY